MQANLLIQNLGAVIGAIGGLGTAAFGLLEALKPAFASINRIGFDGIRRTVTALTPPEMDATGLESPPKNALPRTRIFDTLESNWVNGNDLGSQKAIAKSLIKLHLSAGNAVRLADATNVDAQTLKDVATNIAAGQSLDQPQSDTYSRFDLIVTAMLDECYQRADQIYRNRMRAMAALIAVVLAILGGWAVAGTLDGKTLGEAVLVGVLATPLAPIAKDLSTALATAVNTMQLVKKP